MEKDEDFTAANIKTNSLNIHTGNWYKEYWLQPNTRKFKSNPINKEFILITNNKYIMKKTILLSIIFAATTVASFSQTKQESIKELFHLMQTDSMMEKTFAAIVPAIMTQMPKEEKDSTKLAQMNQFMNSLIASSKEMCKKMLNEDIVVLYDKFFTENEIKDLIIFYKTPTGKKMIEKSPEMQIEIMNMLMQKYMPELQNNLKEFALKMQPPVTK